MSDDRKTSPLGDRRERAVPCQKCQRQTWNISGICDRCLDADALASPEELADMFGVTDLTDIADDLYEQYEEYERWMTEEVRDHPTLSGGSWALIEEAEPARRTPTATGCVPGAPSLGHVLPSEEGAREEGDR